MVPDDDYWQDSDSESSGLSSYGDDDSDGNGRKISSGSQDSSSVSNYDTTSPVITSTQLVLYARKNNIASRVTKIVKY